MEPTPLINAIESYETASLRNGDLSQERINSLNYYLGKPFGNEVEGRSQVVSRDVADTIEWIKPSLMRIFASGDDIVSFDPKGPEDVDGAQQESDFANYILTQKNSWFRTSYVWFTDALMQKNAYIKAWWDEKTDVDEEKYQGLTEDQLALIGQDPEVQIVSHEVYPDPSFPGMVDPMQMQVAQAMGQQPPQAPQLHDITCKRTSVYGCVKYREIPPERVIVSQWASSIDLEDVDFVEHFEWQTKSEMLANDLKLPESFGDESYDHNLSEEEARNLYGEIREEDSESSPGMRRYKVRECWLKFDKDKDGIAELLHAIVVGRHELLVETAPFIPMAAITPKMMPHRHVGRSVSDEIMDLQLIKSTLMRGMLDNMYLANNGRYGVNEKTVNLDDMLTSRPGGVVRTQGNPGEAIMPFTHPNMMAQGIQAIEYMDQQKQNRTGVTAYVTSVDENVLNKTAAGTSMLQNAAMAKIELIARVFAETGVKRLVWLIHAMSQMHARKAEVVRLRNKWVTVDPRQWKKRQDMTVSVGLGTGNRDQQLIHLQGILGLQKEALPLGLASLQNVHHALSKFTQAAGFKDHESFWTAPQEGAQLPQPPNPLEEEKLKQEAENQRTQFKETEETKRQQMKIESDERIKVAELTAGAQEAQFQAQQQKEMKQADLQHDAAKTHVTLSAKSQEKQAPGVKVDVGGAFIEKLEQGQQAQAQVLAQAAEMIAQAAQVIAQSAQFDEVIVRDPKTNRAVGKKRVPMGTLQ